MTEVHTFRSLEQSNMLDDGLFLKKISESIAQESRIRVVSLLSQKGPTSVRDISKILDESQPDTSHHLDNLKLAGLAFYEREGKENHWYLIPQEDVRIQSHFQALSQALLDPEAGFNTEEMSGSTFSSLSKDESLDVSMLRELLRTTFCSKAFPVTTTLALAPDEGVPVLSICEKVHMSQPLTSNYLAKLKKNGFAESKKNGKQNLWRLKDQELKVHKHIYALINAFREKDSQEVTSA